MHKMITYKDTKTGYTIQQYTQGPDRNSKLYFTTENFSTDDRYFFCNCHSSEAGLPDGGLYRVEAETGHMEKMAGNEYRGFAMDRTQNYGVLCRDNIVCRLDCETGVITEIGALPEGGGITGHLTTADSGRIACSYRQANKICALVILDPDTGKSEIVYQSDHHLGHAQICPTDENLLFYIHETTGDALQRTWMFDIAHRMPRPYYVEHPGEWITHEVWSADGEHMAFMKLPGQVLLGDKDGRHFDLVGAGAQLLHPCISRDNAWICADRTSYFGVTVQDAIVLINPANGKSMELAVTGAPKTGADHQHPSFDRRGDRILFSNPDENGIAQVCCIDLRQVDRSELL